MQNHFDFTIDEYEKSAKEFEKYVNTIPKKVPLKHIKSNTIGSLMKEYYQKSQYTETEELFMLNQIFHTLRNWGNSDKSVANNNDEMINLCDRHNKLTKRLEEVDERIKSLSELAEFTITEANGFASVAEVEDVVKVLSLRINKQNARAKENEKILLQIQDLKDIIPQVRKIQKISEDIERLQEEKIQLSEYIEQTVKLYEECASKNEL